MTSPIMHSLTKKDYDACVAHPSHAVAIFGLDGIGKTHLSLHLAAAILDRPVEDVQSHPYFKMFSPNEKGVIKIEQAHEIVSFMKLKTTGTQQFRRVVIIEHAQMLTSDAQNALLKVIEEPPDDTVIIITATSEQSLLPTIRSRAQRLHIRIPLKEDVYTYYSVQAYSKQQLDRAYLVSAGLPGLCNALLIGDETHPLVKMINAAKEILAADTFTRLTLVDCYAERTDASLLVNAVGQIARSGLAASVTRVNTAATVRWHTILSHVAAAQMQIASSGSPKLVLANLFLHI